MFSGSDKTNKKNYLEAANIIDAVNPHGASFKCLQHFIQCHNSSEKEYFRKYDYGQVENLKKYGSPKPPKYDLSLITTKMNLYYGTGDLYVTKKTAEEMVERMENADVNLEWLEDWGHMSFIFGTDMKEFYRSVFDRFIKK